MDSATTTTSEWWRNGVVYQVYVRSFADGNGDGTGDVTGLRSKLDYLRDLGVNALWINPWYSSPLRDGGYDVADYRQIDERFGTTEEVELFIGEAHDRGIKVIADLVPNHTSSDHRWFQEALAAGPGSPERDRYVFKEGKGENGELPPTDWTAVFGGSAWERVEDGQWYLHIFDPSQPDLNWENEEVREEFDDIFRFWLDRGIDGFRIDVAHGLVKDTTFPDVGKAAKILESETTENHPFWDRDGVHEINRRWRSVLNEYEDRMMVAEAWVAANRLPLYLRPDEYHQSFNFDLLATDWVASAFAEVIEKSVTAADEIGASSTWVLSNHDVMRHATRYGLDDGTPWRQWPMAGPVEALDVERGQRRDSGGSANYAFAAWVDLRLPRGGTRLPEVWDLPEDVLEDPTWLRSEQTEKGRDGCRVPLPWKRSGESFGFGSGGSWLPQPAFFGDLSAEAQMNDPDSCLNLYREAIAVRSEHLAQERSFELDSSFGPDVLAYRRGSVLVIVNMGAESVEVPTGRTVLMASEALNGQLLASDAAVWLL